MAGSSFENVVQQISRRPYSDAIKLESKSCRNKERRVFSISHVEQDFDVYGLIESLRGRLDYTRRLSQKDKCDKVKLLQKVKELAQERVTLIHKIQTL